MTRYFGRTYCAPVPHYGVEKKILIDITRKDVERFAGLNYKVQNEKDAKRVSLMAAESFPFLGYKNYLTFSELPFEKVIEVRQNYFAQFEKGIQSLKKMLVEDQLDCFGITVILSEFLHGWQMYHNYVTGPSRHTVLAKPHNGMLRIDMWFDKENPSWWLIEENKRFFQTYQPIDFI